MPRSLLFIILVVTLLFIQYQLWFAKRGLVEVWHNKKEITIETEKNNALAERNKRLRAEVIRLKKSGSEIEEQARSELGMLKQGETFYRTVVTSKQKS